MVAVQPTAGRPLLTQAPTALWAFIYLAAFGQLQSLPWIEGSADRTSTDVLRTLLIFLNPARDKQKQRQEKEKEGIWSLIKARYYDNTNEMKECMLLIIL